MSGRVTHLKRKFSKTCFFSFSTCGTFICLLSDGNSFNTFIIYVDFGKRCNAYPCSTDTFQPFNLRSSFNKSYVFTVAAKIVCDRRTTMVMVVDHACLQAITRELIL